jgi:hypothetical protein
MADHYYRVGQFAVVHNQTMSGKPILEGRAQIKTLCARDHTYMVKFDGEQGTFERHIPAPEA